MRTAKITRKTGETDIKLKLNLDGQGKAEIDTGIGFFDHMMDAFARHGMFDVDLKVKGDLNVDGHHSVEDTGIVLGEAIRKAVGDKKGIRRYGYFVLPMDEALVVCAIDLCGRPYEFFYAVSYSAAMNLHFRVLSGNNTHHIIEAMFKAFSKALDMATGTDPRIADVLSTKGVLE
jgi:imidazoleglycerol-phosphate dehydratase